MEHHDRILGHRPVGEDEASAEGVIIGIFFKFENGEEFYRFGKLKRRFKAATRLPIRPDPLFYVRPTSDRMNPLGLGHFLQKKRDRNTVKFPRSH